jgi:uncharacterized protein with von Willebrand factor type A (vWA) domain
MGPFLNEASLLEVVAAHVLLERIERGHEPGLPHFRLPEAVRKSELVGAALRAIEGLAGSDRLEDAVAILELVHIYERQPPGLDAIGGGRLGWALDRLAEDGSPLMQGAAGVARVLLGRDAAAAFGERLGSWVDAALSADGRRMLAERLRGALVVGSTTLESNPAMMGPLIERVDALGDADFLGRLPALRDGFETLSPAARERLLRTIAERVGAGPLAGAALDAELEEEPETLAAFASIDAAARDAVRALAPELLPSQAFPLETELPNEGTHDERDQLRSADRWRLILGRQRDKLPPGDKRVAAALDELYGVGHGEGAGQEIADRARADTGAREPTFPSVREWTGELDAIFGAAVREEVLGRAVQLGRSDALGAIELESVTPSVALLEQVLALRGSLPEAKLAPLRRLVSRLVQELVRELARRLQPALAGLATPRPTSRRRGPLDLARTIRANLKHAQRGADGAFLVTERPIFRARARRGLDWRVIVVVDMSGSMEPSIIYSALVAAILSALPAFTVHFFAFTTNVIDLSDLVSDPLRLLLEVAIGGGTHIAQALRYARERIVVPQRTIVLTVTDFGEGFPVGQLLSEVRALVETGVKVLGLAALDDSGQPRYHRGIAELVAGAGMPVAALTPLELARWIGEKVRA